MVYGVLREFRKVIASRIANNDTTLKLREVVKLICL